MIAQAEHDEDATAWCVTTDVVLADQLPAALEKQLARNPRAAVARASLERNGLIVWVPSIQDAIQVANLRAPEHLEIVTHDPEAVAQGVRHAGAIFLGDNTRRWATTSPGRHAAWRHRRHASSACMTLSGAPASSVTPGRLSNVRRGSSFGGGGGPARGGDTDSALGRSGTGERVNGEQWG
jgi:hypothetical protein